MRKFSHGSFHIERYSQKIKEISIQAYKLSIEIIY